MQRHPYTEKPCFIFAVLLLGLLLVVPALNSRAQDKANLAPFQSGERLQYKVKWLFFRLGTIVVTTESALRKGKGKYYVASISLDSNPTLFFINLHNRYWGTVNISPLRCEEFLSFELQGSDTLVTHYVFEDSHDRVRMEQRIYPADTLVKGQTLDSIQRFFDGASLFFLARSLLHSNSRFVAPTMIDMELLSTDITFTDRIVPIEIGTFDEEIETKELFGQAHFGGKTFGGFSGQFRGWFSNDDAAIPIRAEMSITLGTVVVELEEWNRAGWQPPVFQEEK